MSKEEEKVEELKVPEFKSVIPGYLADGLTPAEKHTIETLSIMAQRIDWLVMNLIETNKDVQVAKLRTEKYEKLMIALKSKWAILGYIVAMIAPLFVLRLVNKIWPM